MNKKGAEKLCVINMLWGLTGCGELCHTIGAAMVPRLLELNIMTIKIDLPATHTVTKGPRDKSWQSELEIDVSKLSPEIVARLAIHGLHQKIADAASAAKTQEDADAAMGKAMDALLAGEWAQRSGGGGVDEFTRVARMIVRKAFKDANGPDSKERKAFLDLDSADQDAKLDEWFAANEATFRPVVEAEVASRKAERERRAKLAKATEFSL